MFDITSLRAKLVWKILPLFSRNNGKYYHYYWYISVLGLWLEGKISPHWCKGSLILKSKYHLWYFCYCLEGISGIFSVLNLHLWGNWRKNLTKIWNVSYLNWLYHVAKLAGHPTVTELNSTVVMQNFPNGLVILNVYNISMSIFAKYNQWILELSL